MVNLIPGSSDETYLLLIRHGATEANERRPYILQGHAIDMPLSARGRAQAEALGRFLAQYPLRAVYASTLQRAIETAGHVAQHHGLTVETCPELNEVNVGEWEGLDWGTIQQRNPEEYERFMSDPGRHAYLGGESYGDVHRRAQPRIGEILAKHRGQAVAVVAHNVVNRAYLAPLLGLDLKVAKDIHQTNTGVNILKDAAGKTKVVTLNAFFHLEDQEL